MTAFAIMVTLWIFAMGIILILGEQDRVISFKEEPNHTSQEKEFDEDPDAVLQAYLEAFPTYPKDSLRAKNRANLLKAAKTRPRKKS
tara:strand:+ start:197 stop:457 length:261 start_codon:yes stop_codon:yes gene_type:complete